MARLGPHARRRLTSNVIWKRTDIQTVNASSSTLTYSPASGQWTTAALSRNSCTSQAESTISFNSSVSLVFVGTSLSVNIIKDTNGAPYNVTLDGNVSQYDSYATSQQCTADFQVSNLAAKQHTVVVTHNGEEDLSASGRSTLYFVSFVYTPSGNTQTGGSSSVGPIVGGVIGAIAVVFLCGFLWWFFRRRKARAEKEKEEVVSYEPFESSHVISQYPPNDSDGRPVQENEGSSQNLFNAQRHQPPRTKGAEAASNSRFARTSPWASSTSHNRSRPNVAGESGHSASDAQTSSQSPSESLRPTSISQYPPSGTEFSSPAPVFMQPLPESTPQSSRRYGPPPSTVVGESVLIDDSDYIAPPSYSPPPSNHPRESVRRGVQEKATYGGTRDSGGSSANLLSPNSTHQALPGGNAPGTSASQMLSQADIDVIARRVADIMRSPSSTTGSQYSGVSSSDAANPQVQQAVRVLLAGGDEEHPQTTPAPPEPPNAGN